MNRINTQLGHNRNQQRSQNNQRCTALQEHAQNQQQHVNEHQHHIRITRKVQHRRGDLLRNTLPVQVIAKEGSSNDNQHNRAGAINSFLHNRPSILPLQLLVDEGADNEAIYNSNSAGLRRSEHAHTQTSDNAEREQQCPDGFLKLRHDFAKGGSSFTRRLVATLFGNDSNDNHHSHSHQHAGNIACHKHFRNRNAGNQSIDNQVNARRNNRRAGRGSSRNSSTEGSAVAAFFHFRHQHFALHRSIGIRTAGHAAHQQTQKHVNLRQTAGHMTHEHVSKFHQLITDACIVHDRAGHNEEGNRQQREGLRAGDNTLKHQMRRRGRIQEGEVGNRRTEQRVGDRNTRKIQHKNNYHG